MKYLYIDYTNSVSVKNAKFHGGGNYTKKILLLLREVKILNQKIIVLWPQEYLPQNADEKKIFESENLCIKKIEKLDEKFIFESNSVLFFPLLSVKKLNIAQKLKVKNPTMKIYITIHGLRLLDLKPDLYDKYYIKGLKFYFYGFYSKIEYAIKSFIYKQYIKTYIPYYDKVFTVSNFSLQQIVTLTKVNFISVYYQDIILEQKTCKKKIDKEYILFVSAGRSEKNFMRALEAFSNYKAKSNNQLYLYVTGIKKKQLELFFRNNRINKKIISEWVVCYEYVDKELLADLYKQAKIFLYTSKSEGFGLPVLESFFYEVPIVASYITSIPEVIGSAAYYVNPYSVHGIENGIEYMDSNDNLEKYKAYIQSNKKYIEERIRFDKKRFINEILD